MCQAMLPESCASQGALSQGVVVRSVIEVAVAQGLSLSPAW